MKRVLSSVLMLIVCAPVSAQLNEQTLAGRVIADETWVKSESFMPVGLIGDLMLVGIPNDDEGGDGTGAVWSFKYVNGHWVQQQKILPNEPADDMHFGSSLAVEEQIDLGDAWLAIGAPDSDSNQGSVHLYEREGDLWVFRQVLTTSQSDFYGRDVDINVDIPIEQEDMEWTLVVGAPGYTFEGNISPTGAVFISRLIGDTWSDGIIPNNLSTIEGNNPQVGRSVAIDGDIVFAGAPSKQVNGNHGAGAAYIFSRGQFTPWTLSGQIENPNALEDETNGANFGHDVDVVKQVVAPRIPTGDYYFLVGAPKLTSEISDGQAYIFLGHTGGPTSSQRLTHPAPHPSGADQFGHSVRFRDDLIAGNHLFLISSRLQQHGAVYLYDQPDFPDPWFAAAQMVIPDIADGARNTTLISQAVAAWDELIAVSTANLSFGKDAVYSNPIIVDKDGFEGSP